MGRHNKRGLDYFHIDCDQEDNLTLVEAKHKIAGYGTVIKLWKKIYQFNGYYAEWDEKHQLLFAKDIGVEIEFLKAVVETCFEEGIFHRGLHSKYKILTSSGTQKRWKDIVTSAKRKDTEIDPNHSVFTFIQDENAKTTEEITKTHEESTQSKVEKNRVDKSKVDMAQAPIIQMKSYRGLTEQDFYKEVATFTGSYTKEMLRDFYEYWVEKSPGGKMKFQLEKTWELNLRLKKWLRNQTKYLRNGLNSKNSGTKPIPEILPPGSRGQL